MDIWPLRLYYQSTRSLPCSPCCASILSSLFFHSLYPSIRQSRCFCCVLERSHKLTCWILKWDIKPWGSSMPREHFYAPLPNVVYVHLTMHEVGFHTKAQFHSSQTRDSLQQGEWQMRKKKKRSVPRFAPLLTLQWQDPAPNTSGLMITYVLWRDYQNTARTHTLIISCKHYFYDYHQAASGITSTHLPCTMLFICLSWWRFIRLEEDSWGTQRKTMSPQLAEMCQCDTWICCLRRGGCTNALGSKC